MAKEINPQDSSKILRVDHKIKEFSRSPVDIIIPFHGQCRRVTALVDSILTHTRSNPYQITLVDDASEDEKYIESYKDFDNSRPRGTESIIQTIRLDEQNGFGGALKAGFEATHQPWVVFLNSDCVIMDTQWLVKLGKCLLKLKEHNVRMVAPRTNNPGEGTPAIMKGSRNNHQPDYILNEKEHLPLFCAMCHRELFKRIGGFIKEYPFCWYEDEELAYRMNLCGYKQAVCGSTWVYHEGEATIKELCKNDAKAKAIIENNMNLCMNDMRSYAKK